MSIILEIQADALKSDTDILSLLRKTLLVANKLELADFAKWTKYELDGYKNEDIVPDYRKVGGRLSALTNSGWVRVYTSNSNIVNKDIRLSISKIYHTFKDSKYGETYLELSNSEITFLVNAYDIETNFKLAISNTELKNICDGVQNKILEWSLLLEKKGILGENMTFSKDEIVIAQTINNYITNIYGDVNETQFQQGTNESKQEKS